MSSNHTIDGFHWNRFLTTKESRFKLSTVCCVKYRVIGIVYLERAVFNLLFSSRTFKCCEQHKVHSNHFNCSLGGGVNLSRCRKKLSVWLDTTVVFTWSESTNFIFFFFKVVHTVYYRHNTLQQQRILSPKQGWASDTSILYRLAACHITFMQRVLLTVRSGRGRCV